jgi:hypothetical protein
LGVGKGGIDLLVGIPQRLDETLGVDRRPFGMRRPQLIANPPGRRAVLGGDRF